MQTDAPTNNSIVATIIRPLTVIGALGCSWWLLYVEFTHTGALAAGAALFLLGGAYAIGLAPMFALAASLLTFYDGVVGVWLPVLSYVVAVISLYLDFGGRPRPT